MNDIKSLITEYVDSVDTGIPIFTNDIHKFVHSKIENANPFVINEYINRHEKNDDNFIRHQKGIYYKSEPTAFGMTKIKRGHLISRLYLKDGDDVIGYETGPSLINRMGLTTQVPRDAYYATNNYRTTRKMESVVILKPIIKVTKENYKYLQILDVLKNQYQIYFEVDNVDEIIRLIMRANDLSFETLLFYATFYNDKEVYKRVADLTKVVLVDEIT